MSYFSRLTDIVTCNLTELLAEANDPAATLEEIIAEMREGVGSAQRSLKTATDREERLRSEIEEHSGQVDYWAQHARRELKQSREDVARQSLRRKREVEDLVDGLRREHASALRSAEERLTTLQALKARLADAVRRRGALSSDGRSSTEAPNEDRHDSEPLRADQERDAEIEAELEALKKELGA